MIEDGAYLIWCPCTDEAEARQIANTLLDEGLIACANLLPGVVSLFEWQGTRGEAMEVVMLAKTHPARAKLAVARMEQLHSYQTPAIIGWQAGLVATGARAWLRGLLDTEAGHGPD